MFYIHTYFLRIIYHVLHFDLHLYEVCQCPPFPGLGFLQWPSTKLIQASNGIQHLNSVLLRSLFLARPMLSPSSICDSKIFDVRAVLGYGLLALVLRFTRYWYSACIRLHYHLCDPLLCLLGLRVFETMQTEHQSIWVTVCHMHKLYWWATALMRSYSFADLGVYLKFWVPAQQTTSSKNNWGRVDRRIMAFDLPVGSEWFDLGVNFQQVSTISKLTRADVSKCFFQQCHNCHDFHVFLSVHFDFTSQGSSSGVPGLHGLILQGMVEPRESDFITVWGTQLFPRDHWS